MSPERSRYATFSTPAGGTFFVQCASCQANLARVVPVPLWMGPERKIEGRMFWYDMEGWVALEFAIGLHEVGDPGVYIPNYLLPPGSPRVRRRVMPTRRAIRRGAGTRRRGLVRNAGRIEVMRRDATVQMVDKSGKITGIEAIPSDQVDWTTHVQMTRLYGRRAWNGWPFEIGCPVRHCQAQQVVDFARLPPACLAAAPGGRHAYRAAPEVPREPPGR